MAITTGMARVAIQKRRFFTVRVNSNPTTVPRLCRRRAASAGPRGGLAGAGEGSVWFLCHRVYASASRGFAVDLDEDLVQGRPGGGEGLHGDAVVDEFAQDGRFVRAGAGESSACPPAALTMS